MSDKSEKERSASLIGSIRDLPSLVINLIKAELAQFKAELTSKAIHAGVGIGLFIFAGVVLFFMIGVLVAAAVLGLAVVFPGWLAALLTAAGLLIIIAILVLVGLSWFKKGMPPAPTDTIASVKEDVDAVKGMGKYDR